MAVTTNESEIFYRAKTYQNIINEVILDRIMDEIIDIVDKNNMVIGQELKSKCHRDRILHRGATIIVFKDKSYTEIIIQKRSRTSTKPGKFCLPGGHLSSGEDYLAGAKRELREELFHNQELPKEIEFKKLFKIKKSADDDQEFHVVYYVVYGGPFNNDLGEVENFFWENIKETVKKIKNEPENYTETTALLLNEYQRKFMS